MRPAPAPKLTIVVPLRIARAPREAWGRLARLLAALPEGVGAVVADDTADPGLRARTAALIARAPEARHLECLESAAEPFSIGRLRDLGTEAAPEGFALFHDVDFAAPPAFYARLRAHLAEGELAENPDAFRCVPVWFLTRAGGLAWRASPEATWAALVGGRPPAARRLLANRLTRGSSAILLRRRLLLEVGGHSDCFAGHGAEDFELLHRLSARSPRGPRPPNYARDFGSRDTGEDGFRAYFARYAAPLLSEGLAMVHVWHRLRTEDARYYAARRANFARLAQEMAAGGPGAGAPGGTPGQGV